MGPQNLPLMLAAYNGDTAAYAGEERLAVGDPALHADNFRRPLFIYYGEKDTLVPPEHSRQLIRALRAAGKTVEVHTHPTEAHGFSSPANEADLYLRMTRNIPAVLCILSSLPRRAPWGKMASSS